ncbi:carboxyvinyl-carboxyphosphonate phosphorylmutase [Pedobacter lusitanus]|uniref:Carboxyvinyl-carboxyphosphonate phosphorylmutase n=1 Tax=Pedobacter lusitanus TaxID=1503925 RepID=A0A0D0F5C5_9SPHI|nr:isocitrate lyase/phosphoenolpyruvate mutase family protein [Pedobacter lusitanus]KIO76783.1 carboxyvinyl-carboxyphosphonate phosphorylmutase [Pedobacter lusitanus]
MASSFEKFRDLHHQENLLLTGNVWNVSSALIYEQLGFKAIALSSSAVAHSLGYEDGEGMPFEEYLFVIKRIMKSVSLPVSVDLEAGYGDTAEKVTANILRLTELGVAGINIEDSLVRGAERKIQDAEIFTEKLKNITEALKNKGTDIYINVRSDAYILGLPDPLQESKRRIRLYETANVHGIFLPFILNEKEIAELTRFTGLPLHVMCMPGLPGFQTLQRLGVKRISMGGYAYRNTYEHLEKSTKEIVEMQSFDSLFDH